MSRGVVLWPDEATSRRIVRIWLTLADAGLPSLASLTHRRHRPHVSLIVGETLPTERVLDVIGATPTAPVPLLIESVGVFPGPMQQAGDHVLFLAAVPSLELLGEQRRVYDAAAHLVEKPWTHFEPGGWTAHLTLGFGYRADQITAAVPIVTAELPIAGSFHSGGVEDGATGRSWRSLPPPAA